MINEVIHMDLEEFLNTFKHQPIQPVPRSGRRDKAKGRGGEGAREGQGEGKDRWVNELLRQIEAKGLPKPRLEYTFHAERKWRFDLDWKPYGKLVAVEVDGGAFARPVVCHNCGQTVKRKLKDGRWVTIREGGRHNTGTGYEADREKLNEAALYGWKVIGVTAKAIQNGQALDWIERALL